MGKNFTNHGRFTESQIRKARIAKAIGHPVRLAILEYISKHRQCIAKNMIDAIPLSHSTIAQHLKLLRVSGLLRHEINGKQTSYYINEEGWNEANSYFKSIFK